MEKYKEKAGKLFDRVGPLKVSDEEIVRLAKVPYAEVSTVRVFLDEHTKNIKTETQP